MVYGNSLSFLNAGFDLSEVTALLAFFSLPLNTEGFSHAFGHFRVFLLLIAPHQRDSIRHLRSICISLCSVISVVWVFN